jgi:methylthioribose-1-phosphate isomerase
MIDQRLLPGRLSVLVCRTPAEVADAIRDMAIRGAPAIGAAAAFGLALAAVYSSAKDWPALRQDLMEASRLLAATRPTAVNLRWGLDLMLRFAHSMVERPVPEIVAALVAEAQAIAGEDVETNRRMGRAGAALIHDGDTVLTHCNAGALATVDYGTALGVVRAAVEQGKRVQVLADETRPRLQGARLTAWELQRDGIPVTLIADNAAGHFLRRGKVQVVLVGADRIAANGDAANKIGTYKLAVVAKENGVPFYVVAPLSTVDLSAPDGDAIPIEERDPREVTEIDGVRIAPEGVAVANPAFDITPHRYLSGIVTEAGIMLPPFREALANACRVRSEEATHHAQV